MNNIFIIGLLNIVILLVVVSEALSAAVGELDKEDADCEWLEIKGKCVPSSRCITTLDQRSEEKPPVCSQEGAAEVKICCTDCQLINDTSNVIVSPSGGIFWKDGRKARDHCLEYLKTLPHSCNQEGFYGGITRRLNAENKCHTHNIWAIGGAPPMGLELPETPYEALMGLGHDLESAIWLTAGAIISNKFIVTSANGHSTTINELPAKYVAVGVKNRQEDKKNWQIHTVKKIHTVPEYDGGWTKYHDMALLELETPIKFSKDVLPACLPDPAENINVTTAKLNVWKEGEMGIGEFLNTSHVSIVEELTAEECRDKIYEVNKQLPEDFINFLPQNVNESTQLCFYNDKKSLNTIGAPVVVDSMISHCMNTVIGVTAYTTFGSPSVYTKLAYYLPWIESVVWPSETNDE